MVHFIGIEPPTTGLTFLLYLIIFLAGIGFTGATLLHYFSDLTVAISMMVLAFGTNLFFIVSMDYRLQPILLFSLYAMVVFLTVAWHEHQKQIHAILMSLGLGLIILLQPTGVVALLIPVLWGVYDKASWRSKILLIKNNSRQADLFLGCLAILVLPTVLIWKISPGEIPFLSFNLPGVFYSFSSWLWMDLFSFDHGWFIYTPIMIFAFIGFHFLSEKHRPIFYAVYILIILDIFLETSWSKLGTTPVFGQIAFIPVYALLTIPAASFFRMILEGRKIPAILLSLVVAFFLFLNIFQSWQFSQGIILSSEMNADNYSRVFGRTHVSDIEKQQMAGVDPDPDLVLKDEKRFSRTTLAFYNFEEPNSPYKNNLRKVPSKNGMMAFTLDGTSQFSPTLDIQYGDFRKRPRVGMRITASVFAEDAPALSDVNLVITSNHKGDNYLYKRLNLGDLKLKPGIWNTVSLYYLIPADPPPEDKLGACVWYTGNSRVYVDDIKFEAFEPKK
jgi:hypothetical protein